MTFQRPKMTFKLTSKGDLMLDTEQGHKDRMEHFLLSSLVLFEIFRIEEKMMDFFILKFDDTFDEKLFVHVPCLFLCERNLIPLDMFQISVI